MQRGVLQQLRGGPFDPRVRRFGKPAAEFLNQPRFAKAGLTDDLDELPFAGSRAPLVTAGASGSTPSANGSSCKNLYTR